MSLLKQGKRLGMLFVALSGVLFSPIGMAAGTTAGTDITNTATATYQLGGNAIVSPSNTVTTTVDELLSSTVTWQDAADIPVAPGDTAQVLTFQITNTGNGEDSYGVTVNNTVGGG